MKARGNGHEAKGDGAGATPLAHSRASLANLSPIASGLLPIAFYVSAIVLAFWGLLQVDVQLARAIQKIDEPWLEQLGLIGQWLGDWRVLLGVSGILLALGTAWSQAGLRQVGLSTLIAHAYAAGAVQALKHLIGRARPRLTQESSLLIGPNFDSGFDSFPSGHTTASVAIAIVLARRFPRVSWLAYGIAAVIAVSRVIKGSHFPVDVLAGVCLGSLTGHLAAAPPAQWRNALAQGIRTIWPWIVGGAALLMVLARAMT